MCILKIISTIKRIITCKKKIIYLSKAKFIADGVKRCEKWKKCKKNNHSLTIYLLNLIVHPSLG
jgi:hypothetical protein